MMKHKLTLYYTELRCEDETGGNNWWWYDKINYMGLGITKEGTMFMIPYQDLGDWDAGDSRTFDGPNDPRSHIIDLEVSDRSLEASILIFVTENDGTESIRENMRQLEARYHELMAGVADALDTENKHIDAFNYRKTDLIKHIKYVGGEDDFVIGYADLHYKYTGPIDLQGQIRESGDLTPITETKMTGDNSIYKLFTGFRLQRGYKVPPSHQQPPEPQPKIPPQRPRKAK